MAPGRIGHCLLAQKEEWVLPEDALTSLLLFFSVLSACLPILYQPSTCLPLLGTVDSCPWSSIPGLYDEKWSKEE